jgi:hypothetical protein
MAVDDRPQYWWAIGLILLVVASPEDVFGQEFPALFDSCSFDLSLRAQIVIPFLRTNRAQARLQKRASIFRALLERE